MKGFSVKAKSNALFPVSFASVFLLIYLQPHCSPPREWEPKGVFPWGHQEASSFPQPCRHVDCWCCGVGSVSRVRVACDTSSGCGRRAEASVHTRPLSWFFCGPGALRTRRAHLKLLFSSHLWLKLYALLLCSEEARSTEVSLQV